MMAQENPKLSLKNIMPKILKCIRTVKQQSINCTPFKAPFVATANTMWHNLVKHPSKQLKLGSNNALLSKPESNNALLKKRTKNDVLR